MCDEDTKCFIYEFARSLTADHDDDDANAEKKTEEDGWRENENVMNEGFVCRRAFRKSEADSV